MRRELAEARTRCLEDIKDCGDGGCSFFSVSPFSGSLLSAGVVAGGPGGSDPLAETVRNVLARLSSQRRIKAQQEKVMDYIRSRGKRASFAEASAAESAPSAAAAGGLSI